MPTEPGSLAAALAGVPGLAVRRDAPLARLTTLRIGGPAELLVEATSERGVVALLRAVRAHGVPFQLLGAGSNVLIPDEGLAGVVVRLTGELDRVRVHGERVSAGAGASLPRLARRCTQRGLLGLEALTGFPSSVGGAVHMNAGCYGVEIQDVLLSARVVELDGTRRRLATADLRPAYRHTILAETGAIVTRAFFALRRGDPGPALARVDELNAKRWAALPSGFPNAGSIFKNPPGNFAGRLIEDAGLKGRRRGNAELSAKHANVIVNRGGASAEDVLALMLDAYRAVAERCAVALEPEVVLTGGLAARWRRATGR